MPPDRHKSNLNYSNPDLSQRWHQAAAACTVLWDLEQLKAALHVLVSNDLAGKCTKAKLPLYAERAIPSPT